MGYDDNTPLTGVTGGGLPAEIWREVDGPGRGRPAGAGRCRSAQPEPPVAAGRRRRRSNPVAGVETAVRPVVQNVINGLFGRN